MSDMTPLASLRHYDALRDEAANVTRQGNVDVFLDPQGEQVVLCHLSSINSFNNDPSDDEAFRRDHEKLMATALAIEHLNTGNSTFVSSLEALPERCPLRFTTEFKDSSSAVLGLGHIIDQTSHEPNTVDRIPCGFLGTGSSSVSIPTSLVTGLLGYIQVSQTNTSPQLDDKAQYPLYGRMAPHDQLNAIPVISFLDKIWRIKNLAIVNLNDAYGNGYAQGLREAAAEYAPEMKINQIPMDNTPEGIVLAVERVKELGNRFIFLIAFENDPVLEEAYKQGVAGTGLHTWFGGDTFWGPGSTSYDVDDPLYHAYKGTSTISFAGGTSGDPLFDKFLDALGTLNNPVDMKFAADELFLPPPPGYGPPFANDKTFLHPTGGYSEFLPLYYEAAIALGLSACNALTSDNILTGKAHFEAFKELSFTSISGQVGFDSETGTRTPQGMLYKITNYVPEEHDNGKMGFKGIVSHLLKNSEWDEREAYLFSDGTTTIPADIPPQDMGNDDDLIVPVVVGALACVLILVAIIGYLIYDRRRRANDGVLKVKREEIVFGSPPEVLGRGSFGLVLLGEYRGTSVAVKHLIRSEGERPSKPITGSSMHGAQSSSSSKPITSKSWHPSSSSDNIRSSPGKPIMDTSLQSPGKPIGSNSVHSSSSNQTPLLENEMDDGYTFTMSGKASGLVNTSAWPSQWKAGKQSGIMAGASRLGSMAVTAKKQNGELMLEEILAEMNVLAKLRHTNITTFMGVVLDKKNPMIIMEHVLYGSLFDVLHNKTMEIDGEIILPILRDIVQGVRFLHAADKPIIHGDLKCANILVDNHFRAKVADFGLTKAGDATATGTPFWMAPELLRGDSTNTPASDVYSFGVILFEVYSRKEPYENERSSDVLPLVADSEVKKRPDIPDFMPQQMQSVMGDCFDDKAVHRPSFEEIDTRFKRITSLAANPTNFGSVNARAQRFGDTFPPYVVEALREGHQVEPEHKDMVTIFASDIVGFDKLSEHWSEAKVRALLDRFHGKLDKLCKKHDIFKIHVIGVSYYAVANLVKDQSEDHCKRVVDFAQEALLVSARTLLDESDPYMGSVVIRVGVHCGPVVAGVVGNRMPRYSLFGDTINTAMKMETTSDLNRISLSKRAALILGKQDPMSVLEDRGPVRISGKGKMHCYWLGATNVASDALGRTLARKQNRLIARSVNMTPEQAPEIVPEPVPALAGGLVPLQEGREEIETGDAGAGPTLTHGAEAFDPEYEKEEASSDDSPV